MQTDATLLAKNSQHCWMLHVASVCARCCVLLGVIAQSLKPVKPSTSYKQAQQVPNLSDQQFWELLRPFARSLSNGDGDVNENGKTAIGFFFSKTTTLHVHQAFLYISLPLWHVLSRFMEDVNKRRRIFLSLFLNLRAHARKNFATLEIDLNAYSEALGNNRHFAATRLVSPRNDV